MKRFLSCLAVLLVLALLLPVHAVTAATSGEATGQITVGRQPARFAYTNNTSEALEIYTDAGLTTRADTLTPLVTYYVKATLTSPNTLADLDSVKVILHYYDANSGGTGDISSTAVADTQKVAILTCTNAGGSSPTWSIDAGTGTTWSIVAGECSKPAASASTGNYVFAFKPGKVATESTGGVISNPGFALFGWVKNKGNQTDSIWYQDNNSNVKKGIYWYGEITNLTSQVSWTSANPGTGFADDVNEVSGVHVTYISNGDYQSICTPTATWNGTSNDALYDNTGACGNANEFAIKGHPTGDFNAAALLVTTGSVTNNAGVQSVEAGNQITNGTMWLKVADVFPVDTYTGKITFAIASR